MFSSSGCAVRSILIIRDRVIAAAYSSPLSLWPTVCSAMWLPSTFRRASAYLLSLLDCEIAMSCRMALDIFMSAGRNHRGYG